MSDDTNNQKNQTQSELFKSLKETKDQYKPVDYLERGMRRHLENSLFFVLGFVLPPVGVVIWAAIHESRPKDAVYPLTAAIIGSVVLLLNVFAPIFLV